MQSKLSPLDALVHGIVAPENLVQSIARFRTLNLLASAAGALIVGSVIANFSPGIGFVFTAAMSVLLLIPAAFALDQRPRTEVKPSVLTELKGGFKIFIHNQSIRHLAILSAIALPLSQLSTAFLSSLIRDDLGGDSADFAFVDAGWPIGGMLAAFALSFGIRSTRRPLRHRTFRLNLDHQPRDIPRQYGPHHLVLPHHHQRPRPAILRTSTRWPR